MTSYAPFPQRPRSNMLPTLIAGAAFVLAGYLVLDRTDLFRAAPNFDPRPVTARGDLMAIEKTTTSIFEKWSPSVVHITTEKLARTVYGGVRRYQEGTGTGFLWDESGTVVTNYHVVKRVVEAGSRLKISLGDELFDGVVVGNSPSDDIAVVRLVAPPRGLQPISIGSSHDLCVGQSVLAIGNPYGFDRSLSTGIISALNRTIDTENSRMVGLIQTDAAINPGNSGGPLLDSAGRLIGMNTAIYSPSGTSAGIGFAVPVDVINEIVPGLLDGQLAQRTLGVNIVGEHRVGRVVGVPIVGLEPGAGAESAGLKPYDVDDRLRILDYGDMITAVNDSPVRSVNDLKRALRGRKRGEKVTVKILRGGPGNAQALEVPVEVK